MAYGTALGVVRAAVEEGKRIRVVATETRPRLQGARLTVFELLRDGIPVTLITDSMVGYVLRERLASKVIVGADRILGDGHIVNKIGTLTIAVVAKHFGVPFYVAAPLSTFDLKHGVSDLVIEERDGCEVRSIDSCNVTLSDVPVYNPAFDVTPPELVTALITERGIIHPPFDRGVEEISGG